MTEQINMCQIHDYWLEPAKVRVSYGLPNFDDEYLEAKRSLFPHAHSYVLGGCTLGEERYIERMVCHKCRVAEKEWKEKRYI